MIFDANRKLVKSLYSNDIAINVSSDDLANGLYFVQIIQSGKVSSKKLMINR